MIEVFMPRLGPSIEQGTVVRWHKAQGETVRRGEVVFDVETEKTVQEVEAEAEGVLLEILVPEGQSCPVGTVLALLGAPGEALASTPKALAPSSAVASHEIEAPSQASANQEDIERVLLKSSPAARRVAREKGVDLSTVSGSGPRGRIVSADLATAKAVSVKAPGATALAAGMDGDAVRALYPPGSFSVTPLDGMRRTIAQRLVQSKQTVPHFYLTATCTLDELLAVRERLNAHAPKTADKTPAWKLSVNDFVIKALALALQRVPAANVTFTDEGILQHQVSDVGVAVSVDGGLFTPVVRAAETKSLSQISIEMKTLAAKARSRQLKPADYQGGTTAVSNLGMFGVEQFNAIINPPHATILAVGAGVETFVPVNRQPVLKTQMKVTLSCDHRAVDGAVGAELLKAFRAFVEEPALMMA